MPGTHRGRRASFRARGGAVAAAAGCALALAIAPPIAVAAPGDIYVTDRDGGPEGTGAVIRIDPSSGAQQVVASGGELVDPTGIAVDLYAFPGHDTLLVADPEAFGGGGAVFRVDPSNGLVQAVSNGGEFVDPRGVTGYLVVADANADPPHSQLGDGDVFAIHPQGGAQDSLLRALAIPSVDPALADPSAVVQSASGPLYVADPEAGGSGTVFALGPPLRFFGSFIRTFASGGSLADPTGLAEVPSGVTGERFVTVADESAAGGTGAILSLVATSQQATQGIVSSGGSFADPSAVAYTPFAGGPLLVADRSAAGGGGALFSVDPATGAQSVVSSGGGFVEPAGVAVVPPACNGFGADVVGSEQADEVTGWNGSQVIATLGGNDRVEAAESGDLVCGGAGDDVLLGDEPEGDPLIVGRDLLIGEDGSDELSGGPLPDRLEGGPDDDKLRAKGGGRDRVKCGDGRDKATADRKDRLRGCERVKRSR